MLKVPNVRNAAPAHLRLGGFSLSFQPFFLNVTGFISAILTPI